jgi:hypothetical protein
MAAEQGTEQWLQERVGYATASKFYEVMMNKTTAGYQGYVAQLALERILNRPTETFKSKAMERGTELEPTARLMYGLHIKTPIEEAPFVKHKTLMAGASPDGLINDDGLVEIKSPLANNHLYTLQTNKVPAQYQWQIVGQQWITGRLWTDYVSYSDEFPKNAALAIIHVERDEEKIQMLEARVKLFLKDVDEAVVFIKNYGVTK